jgi:hypothetical protein
MTLEQIVNTHPCPIIRGKIMENVDKLEKYGNLNSLICTGFFWNITQGNEGVDFWNAVSKNKNFTYDQLKHLDLSYVPEPAKPPVMWRKIDNSELPIDRVVVKNNKNETHYGKLWKYGNILRIDNDNIKDPTHYIPLSDLINLPIED